MKANSNDTLQKHCTKFKRFYGFESDNRVPVIYMHLKSKGIPKIDALKFCSKNICKTDSTKKKDGPVNYRILKIKPNPYNTINGWQLSRPVYDLGKKYYQSYDDFLEQNEMENELEQYFLKNEKHMKGDFKEKIENLSVYYKELNDEYGLSNLNKDRLLKKVRIIQDYIFNFKVKENRDKLQEDANKVKHYIKLSSLKLYNIGEELHQFNSNKETSYIKKLNLLSPIGDSNTNDNLNYNLETEQDKSEDNRRKDSLVDSYSPKIRKPFRINNILDLKKRSTVFLELEAQTNFLKKITNIDKVVETKHFTMNQAKILKIPKSIGVPKSPSIRRQNQELPKVVENEISIENLNIDSSKFANEFNNSKYITLKKKSEDLSDTTPLITSASLPKLNFNEKKKSINKRNTYLLNEIDQEIINDNDFELILKEIIKNHINYQNENKKTFNLTKSNILEEIMKKRRDLNYKLKMKHDITVFNRDYLNKICKTKNRTKNINGNSTDSTDTRFKTISFNDEKDHEITIEENSRNNIYNHKRFLSVND